MAGFGKKRKIRSEGVVEVVNEDHGKALLKSSDGFANTFEPEVNFEDLFYLNDHDARLSLASDTYVQLVMGSGLKIKTQNQKAKKKIEKWLKDTEWFSYGDWILCSVVFFSIDHRQEYQVFALLCG